MIAVGEDRQRVPFVVLGRFTRRRQPAIDAAGAIVDGARLELPLLEQLMRDRVVILDHVFLLFGSEVVVDLGFVAVLIFAGAAAEENAAVEVLAVDLAFELEDEVLVLGV